MQLNFIVNKKKKIINSHQFINTRGRLVDPFCQLIGTDSLLLLLTLVNELWIHFNDQYI